MRVLPMLLQRHTAEQCFFAARPEEILEGRATGSRFVDSKWDSPEAARAYHKSEEYAAAKAKRPRDVAEVTIMLFSGI